MAYQPTDTSCPDVTKKCQHFSPQDCKAKKAKTSLKLFDDPASAASIDPFDDGAQKIRAAVAADTKPGKARPQVARQFHNGVDLERSRTIGTLASAALNALEMSTSAPAKTTHDDVLISNTGWAMDPKSWASRKRASDELARQTQHIASALQRAGENVIRDGDITLIAAVTGIVERLPLYRPVRFLPTVAGRDRRPMVNALKLFMTGHKHAKHFRYAVMTAPAPVAVGDDIREVIQTLSRRISKWADWIKKWDMVALFRGIEFTRKTAAERGMSGRYSAETVLYHVHANVIYWPTRTLAADDWKDFLEKTHEFMGAEWKDNGTVQKVEEIVKYCSKPADTMKADDEELLWLYRATKGLNIAQPLGDFREWNSSLKKNGEKVVRVKVGGDGRYMRVKKLKRPKNEDGGGDDVDACTSEPNNPASNDKMDREMVEPMEPASSTPANIFLGMSLPQWRHTPWAEPMIMIQHYDPHKLAEGDYVDIEIYKENARGWWDDAGAPDPLEALAIAEMAFADDVDEDDLYDAAEAATYKVHTCRLTVQDDQETEPAFQYSQQEIDNSTPKPDDYLAIAVSKAVERGDASSKTIRKILNEIADAEYSRRRSPKLPSVADVQMSIWRGQREKDRQRKLLDEAKEVTFDEFSAWIEEFHNKLAA